MTEIHEKERGTASEHSSSKHTTYDMIHSWVERKTAIYDAAVHPVQSGFLIKVLVENFRSTSNIKRLQLGDSMRFFDLQRKLFFCATPLQNLATLNSAEIKQIVH